jgi:hypothetical protein
MIGDRMTGIRGTLIEIIRDMNIGRIIPLTEAVMGTITIIIAKHQVRNLNPALRFS